MGENIGSAARAMLNFGIDNLRIVNPRDGWPNPKAKALASGAGSVLDSALIFDSVQEACQDMHYVFASSARERKLDKEEISLGESILECKNLLDKGSKVGFLFGPEQSGLSNEDIAFADKIVFLNTSNIFTSINLALTNDDLRKKCIENGNKRLEYFSHSRFNSLLKQAIDEN